MGGAAQGQGQIPGHLVSRGRRSIRVAGERKFETYGELAQALKNSIMERNGGSRSYHGWLESGVSWTLLVLAAPWSFWMFPYKRGRA